MLGVVGYGVSEIEGRLVVGQPGHGKLQVWERPRQRCWRPRNFSESLFGFRFPQGANYASGTRVGEQVHRQRAGAPGVCAVRGPREDDELSLGRAKRRSHHRWGRRGSNLS